METFEFNQDFLQRAKDISLADMLDSPFCQAWVMSCISNCVVNYDKFPECGDQDEFLHYKLNRDPQLRSTGGEDGAVPPVSSDDC